MKIQYSNNNNISSQPMKNVGYSNSAVQNPLHPQMKGISNIYYSPVNISRMAKTVAFKGQWFEDNYLKKVDDKKNQGINLMQKNVLGDYAWYDFDKVGWEHLSKEPLDWKKVKDVKPNSEIDKHMETEFYVFQHANSLAETNDTTWVKRFNHHNVKKPLAIMHSLNSREAKEPPAKNLYDVPADDMSFATNIKALMNMNIHKSLDKDITDKNGNLIIDAIVFDTETTGVNNDNFSKPLDKIIQIGAIQLKNGKIIPETGYSQLINPEIPIPAGATAVHGITDGDVKDKPTMEKVLPYFANDYLDRKNGIMVAYNAKFDLKMLNNAINTHNKYSADQMPLRKAYKVIDPFLLTERIHPYVGVRKRLSEQYKFFFGKNLDDAHDAFADVKGTVNMLKYDLYYLSEKRKDKSIPLKIRDVLLFQNGVVPKNIDMKLDYQGCNADVDFKKSYRCDSINATNFFKNYKITSESIAKMKDDIGEENVNKIINDELLDEEIDLSDKKRFPGNPNETGLLAKTQGIKNAQYVMKTNFMKVLDYAKIDGYKDKSKEEVKDIIAENSKNYVNEDSIDLWVKNPNPDDRKNGNDLPVYQISKKVMLEEIAQREKEKAKESKTTETTETPENTNE